MIKKTLLLAGTLIVLHAVYVRLNHYNGWNGQCQNQVNAIRAQDYLYNPRSGKYVIVGSSLSQRLDMSREKDFANLAFSGMSVFDGFNILAKREKLPEYIFVETNFYDRLAHPDFLSALTDRAPYLIKTKFPSLREKYEPALVLDRYIFSPAVKWAFCASDAEAPPKKTQEFTSDTKRLHDQMVEFRLNDENVLLQDSVVENRIRMLGYWVNYFRSRKCRVVFFEMPVDQSLTGVRSHEQLRDAVSRNFPDTTFMYLPACPLENLQTVDGLHLDGNSAILYLDWFVKEAGEIISSGKE